MPDESFPCGKGERILYCHQAPYACVTRFTWARLSPVESVKTSIRHRQVGARGRGPERAGAFSSRLIGVAFSERTIKTQLACSAKTPSQLISLD